MRYLTASLLDTTTTVGMQSVTLRLSGVILLLLLFVIILFSLPKLAMTKVDKK